MDCSLDSSKRREFTDALGKAVYRFLCLEWAVAWLTETLLPGSLRENSSLTSREAAERFEEAIYQTSDLGEVQPRLMEFANLFGQLLRERDALVHAHPYTGIDHASPSSAPEATRLLFTAKTSRKIWSVDEIACVERRFESAATEAGLVLAEIQAAIEPRQEDDEKLPITGPASPSILPKYAQLPDSDPRALAMMSAAVRAKLQAMDQAEKEGDGNFVVYSIPSYLLARECTELINLIEGNLKPSPVLMDEPNPAFRTSYSSDFDPTTPLVASVDERIADLLGLDQRHSETIQGQRYTVGQEFQPHYDFFHSEQKYTDFVVQTGGQRSWTAMVFLNEPEAGGSTKFPDAGIEIIPEVGKILIWDNMGADGLPNSYSRHQGMPIKAGSKYIITKWFRERTWIRAPDG